MRKTATMLLTGVAVLATACNDDGTSPGDGALPVADAAVLASEQDALSGGMIFDQVHAFGAFGPPPPEGTATLEFTSTRSCMVGGTFSVSGEVERVSHGDGVVEFFLEGEKTRDACAHQRRDVVITVWGTSSFEAYRKSVNRQPTGPQTYHEAGHFRWERSDGPEGECDFDLTSVRNPDSHTRSLSGTICGRTIERTLTWRNGT